MNQKPIPNNQKLTIEAFILCYNEEKIIRYTLNHYLQFCSKIHVLDNFSTDNTLNILKKEYPQVDVFQYDSKNQIRDDYYLHLKNSVWKGSQADFVIICDMDELLYHPNLIKELVKAKKDKVGIPTIEGYNMFSDIFPENYNIPITQQIQTGARNTNFDKSIIFNPKIIKEILYNPGAHSCNPIYNYGYIPKTTNPIKLLHYKYIGLQYVIDKHKIYATRLSDFNKKTGFGAEYLKQEAELIEMFSTLKNYSTKIINN